jgi:spore germination protein GerM
VFFITSLAVFIQSSRSAKKEIAPSVDTQPGEEFKASSFIKFKVFFFGESQGLMKPVVYEIERPRLKEELYSRLLDIMLRGDKNFISPVPEGVKVRSLYFVAEENLLVLDFGDELTARFGGGTTAEMEFVYFIVDNLCFNFKEIKKVKFLVMGNPIKTLGGHLDLESPFYPDFSYFDEQ